MSSILSLPADRRPGLRALLLLALFIGELLSLAVLYQFFFTLECHLSDAWGLCRGLRSQLARALSVMAVASLVLCARPGLIARFLHHARQIPPQPGWMILHALGVALLLLPLLIGQGQDMTPHFLNIAGIFALGSALAALGGLLWFAPAPLWRATIGPDAKVITAALILGLLLPDLADLMMLFWERSSTLTRLTFQSVAVLLHLTGHTVYGDPNTYILGSGEFYVHIAHNCSGVEGLALVAGFTLIYAALFHDQIRPSRYWLVVLPLGLLTSWILNAIRIATLIVIGDRISPQLAVNGFHSYAGWLFFTLLALGLMWFVQSCAWLHKSPAQSPAVGITTPQPPSLRQDWLAARILPFICFMIASTFASAFFVHPELGYPIKALSMLAAVLIFAPALLRHPWQPHWIPLATGAIVGLVWLLTAPSADPSLGAALAGLTPVALALWVALRLLGTVILVPLIEELFFRGYILTRLDRGGPLWRGLALLASSALFGLLHGRWIEGMAAGLVFGLLALWRGRLSDAVWAHISANLLIAAVALIRSDWSLI